MQYLHTNNAASNLRDAITPGSSVITVTSGHGTLFPNPAVDQGFFVTVEDRRVGRLEIMLCTVRTGDSLTVTRGQQGTIPQNFAAGVSVANRITAQILNDFVAATVNVVPLDRIPPIPDAKIIDMSSSKLIGTIPVGLLSGIPSSSIASLDAAKLTGTLPDAVFPTPIPAANLPNIPSAKLTAVPAESLTGTINNARYGANSISNTKIMSDLDATKLATGTVNNARLPTAISVASLALSGNASIAGNVSISGAITTVDSITASGAVSGSLVHRQNGGYVNVGAYSTATYGTGSGRFWYNALTEMFTFLGHAGAADFTIGGSYHGDGSQLTGIPTAYSDVAGYAIGAVLMLLGPNGGHTAGTTYAGSSLRLPAFQVNISTTGMDMAYSSGPVGNWKALQTGSCATGEMCMGNFVRVP